VERILEGEAMGDETTSSVRVTSIFRKEDGVWRLVHRHADPITSPRPAESVIHE
jgi:ketosteroid isomerase-like protein